MSNREKIVLNGISIKEIPDGTRIEYNFTYPEKFKEYIHEDDLPLFIELPVSRDKFDVPESILSVPFVGIMLTATMLLDMQIRVNTLDKKFYESIPQIRQAFSQMFPQANLCFDVIVDNVQETHSHAQNKSSVFFTGGLDATSALIELLNNGQKPTLINIWGGDILLSDIDSHVQLKGYFDSLSASLGIDYIFVKSNLRFLFVKDLGQVCKDKTGRKNSHGWWSSIAHILAMTTAIAPIVYIKGIDRNYIGSSYKLGEEELRYCSDNPDVVNSIKYADIDFLSVDDNIDRIDKAKKIVDFYNKTQIALQLKVCWYRKAGVNCSHCEKCYRTILEILLSGGDPNNFGFKVNEQTYKDIHEFLKYTIVNKGFWQPIQDKFIENSSCWRTQPDIAWILDIKLNSPMLYARKLLRKIKIIK